MIFKLIHYITSLIFYIYLLEFQPLILNSPVIFLFFLVLHTYICPDWHNVTMQYSYLGEAGSHCSMHHYYSESHELLGPAQVL